MQKFSELIKKSTEDGVGKKKPAVQKGRFKIAKSDDDKMLAFDGRMYPSPQMGN